MVEPKKSILGTKWDTKQIIVPLSHYFTLRNYTDRDGKSIVYLVISDQKKKLRVNTGLRVDPKLWNHDKKRLKPKSSNEQAQNLILEEIHTKLTYIITQHFLLNRVLDAQILLDEFQTSTPDFDFITFYKHHLPNQNYQPNTFKSHQKVISKLSAFRKEIPFHKIDEQFFADYRKYYSENAMVTYYSDLKSMKVFLKKAMEKGIRINIDINKLKADVSAKRITYLTPEEVQRLIKYYYSEFVNPVHFLPLGYFLFSCYTGLAVSDIRNRTREELLKPTFNFNRQKSNTFQMMKLNADARKMVEHAPELFHTMISDQKINKYLKEIQKICKIDKKLTMHVGRHTFATNYYRITRDIHSLQRLMGHTEIKTTLIYVHLINSEVMDGMDIFKY